jgi:cytochrome c
MKVARLGVITGAFAALCLLSACGQGGSDTAAPPEAPEATTEAAAPAEAAPEAVPAEAAAPAVGAIVLAVTDAAGNAMSGDPARGARIFRQCATCHATDAGVNNVGPSLHGLFGRTAGTVPNFRYSQANQSSGIVWSDAELFRYLEAPQRVIPGTNMAFNGLRDPQQRADVIAYLKQFSE